VTFETTPPPGLIGTLIVSSVHRLAWEFGMVNHVCPDRGSVSTSTSTPGGRPTVGTPTGGVGRNPAST
jgi:hypothetical protein